MVSLIVIYTLTGWLQKLGRGEITEDDEPFAKGTGEARDDIAAMDREDAVLVSSWPLVLPPYL